MDFRLVGECSCRRQYSYRRHFIVICSCIGIPVNNCTFSHNARERKNLAPTPNYSSFPHTCPREGGDRYAGMTEELLPVHE